jgi:hypothetical protein
MLSSDDNNEYRYVKFAVCGIGTRYAVPIRPDQRWRGAGPSARCVPRQGHSYVDRAAG